METIPSWWQDAICYQIYPRSFADGNGDGIGDIPGIIDKLDYLRSIGVTALWLSPFYPSPNFDWGYDVADYTAVHPDYGTLADIDRLISESNKRNIRIILDLVLNHTSDQHDWFQQSRSGRDNPYHDWYVWRDGKNGGPPNDWEALFGGSAWQYDETRKQYYYHYFFPEQPDLNWRNPAVKQAIFNAVRFWLDRGVDGFRLDAIGTIYEREGFPDCGEDASLELLFLNARKAIFEAGDAGGWSTIDRKLRHQQNLPEVHDLMQELRQLIDSYDERILLGETHEVAYYGNGRNELHSVFNFPLISELNAPELRKVLNERLPSLPDGAWEGNTIGNHDRTRSYTFYADGKHDQQRAQMALAMVMFLRGTPVFYYGEEIGMQDAKPPAIDEFRDGLGVWFYHALRRHGEAHDEAFTAAVDFFCRDRCRTPMQWTKEPNAGFSPADVETWLPVRDDFSSGTNVAEQIDDADSMLTFFKQIGAVRQENEALRRGELTLLQESGDVLAFWRHTSHQCCLVALNMSAEVAKVELETAVTSRIYANYPEKEWGGETAVINLQPYEIWIGESK
jgi:alpha-glucosidase